MMSTVLFKHEEVDGIDAYVHKETISMAMTAKIE